MGFYRSEDEKKKLISVNFYLYFLFLTNIKVTVLLSVRFQDYDKFKKLSLILLFLTDLQSVFLVYLFL